jgi:hypothetical protein
MQDWKRRSDQLELLYDSTVSGGDGNCTTFTDAVCKSIGLRAPLTPESGLRAALSDPRYVARAIEGDPRCEPNRSGGTAGFKHPWIYGKDAYPGNVNPDELGRWPLPSPP